MSTYAEKFQEIAEKIRESDTPVYHYPLLALWEKINETGNREFQPDILQQQGIDPTEYRTVWAIGYAKQALATDTAVHASSRTWHQVAIDRCRVCLSTDEPHNFSEVLPDDYKQKIQAKLDALEPRP